MEQNSSGPINESSVEKRRGNGIVIFFFLGLCGLGVWKGCDYLEIRKSEAAKVAKQKADSINEAMQVDKAKLIEEMSSDTSKAAADTTAHVKK